MSVDQSTTNYGNRELHATEARTVRNILIMEQGELAELQKRLIPANRAVEEAQRRVIALREELRAAENALRDAQDYARRAEESITLRESSIVARRALLHPIRKLPPEMLQEIFVRCIEAVEDQHQAECHSFSNAPLARETSPFLTALALSHVSKRWYAVAQDTSRLWTHIHCDLAGQPSPADNDRWRHSQKLAKLQGMHVTLNSWEEGGHPPPAHRTDNLLNRLNDHALELRKEGEREGFGWSIKRLDIYFKSNVHLNRLPVWRGPMPQELNLHCRPNANRLGLSTPIPMFLNSMIAHATKVSLHGVVSVWDSHGICNNLRQITLSGIHTKSIVECLKKCPNLEELHINSIYPQSTTEAFTHTSLRRLCLPYIAIASSHHGFPQRVTLPNVTKLTMTHLDLQDIEQQDQSSIDHLTHFAASNLPSVNTLHFDSVTGEGTTSATNTTNTTSIFTSTSTGPFATNSTRHFSVNFFDGLQAFQGTEVLELENDAVTPFIQGWNKFKNTDELEDMWPSIRELKIDILGRLPPIDTLRRREYVADLEAIKEVLSWRAQRPEPKASSSASQSLSSNPSKAAGSSSSTSLPSAASSSSASAPASDRRLILINNLDAECVVGHCTRQLDQTSH